MIGDTNKNPLITPKRMIRRPNQTWIGAIFVGFCVFLKTR